MANPKSTQHIAPTGWLTKLVGRSLSISGSLWLSMGWISAPLAQLTSPSSNPEICEVDLNLLKSDSNSDRQNIVTADTVSSKGMTLPSLWWTSEQFSQKLVTNWIANRSEKQIYLLVNTQYWNNLDYVDRYQLIDRFGRVAQGYGYNLQLCSTQKIALASYSCDPIDRQTSCQLWLKTTGQNGLGVETK
jgi:hypothetical protein